MSAGARAARSWHAPRHRHALEAVREQLQHQGAWLGKYSVEKPWAAGRQEKGSLACTQCVRGKELAACTCCCVRTLTMEPNHHK